MAESPTTTVLGRKSQQGMNQFRALGAPLATPKSYATYLKIIDNVKKVVAIAMAICGVGFVICARRDDYLRLTLRQEAGIWRWAGSAFGIGVLTCLVATIALVVEYLARPRPTRFTLGSLFARSVLVLLVVGAILFGNGLRLWRCAGNRCGDKHLPDMGCSTGRQISRAILAILAVVMTGWTVLGTQSAYQYARWHADEIVRAGCDLMDRCPRTEYRACYPARIYTSLFGEEIALNDPRVPQVLRKLGARRIWVDGERVAVYVETNEFDFSCIPKPEIEFQIYRTPQPKTPHGPVWGSHGKSHTKLTDRLWTNIY